MATPNLALLHLPAEVRALIWKFAVLQPSMKHVYCSHTLKCSGTGTLDVPLCDQQRPGRGDAQKCHKDVPCHHIKPSFDSGLVMTCRQVYEEVRPLLVDGKYIPSSVRLTLVFCHINCFREIDKAMTVQQQARIKTIQIWDCPSEPRIDSTLPFLDDLRLVGYMLFGVLRLWEGRSTVLKVFHPQGVSEYMEVEKLSSGPLSALANSQRQSGCCVLSRPPPIPRRGMLSTISTTSAFKQETMTSSGTRSLRG